MLTFKEKCAAFLQGVGSVLNIFPRKADPLPISYEEFARLAREMPPPQSWYEEDTTGLRKPK